MVVKNIERIFGRSLLMKFAIIRKNAEKLTFASKRRFKSIMAAATYRKNVLSKKHGELFVVPTERAMVLIEKCKNNSGVV